MLIVCETKDGNIVSKARYMEQELYDKLKKIFFNDTCPLIVIDPDKIADYPAELFTEIKIKKKNEKANSD